MKEIIAILDDRIPSDDPVDDPLGPLTNVGLMEAFQKVGQLDGVQADWRRLHYRGTSIRSSACSTLC